MHPCLVAQQMPLPTCSDVHGSCLHLLEALCTHCRFLDTFNTAWIITCALKAYGSVNIFFSMHLAQQRRMLGPGAAVQPETPRCSSSCTKAALSSYQALQDLELCCANYGQDLQFLKARNVFMPFMEDHLLG